MVKLFENQQTSSNFEFLEFEKKIQIQNNNILTPYIKNTLIVSN